MEDAAYTLHSQGYLGSGTEMLSSSAHTLLVQLCGTDPGRAPEPWRPWIAGLYPTTMSGKGVGEELRKIQ